jgi:hypothetical protein
MRFLAIVMLLGGCHPDYSQLRGLAGPDDAEIAPGIDAGEGDAVAGDTPAATPADASARAQAEATGRRACRARVAATPREGAAPMLEPPAAPAGDDLGHRGAAHWCAVALDRAGMPHR